MPVVDYRTENSVKTDAMISPDRYFIPHLARNPETEDGIVSSHELLTRPGDSVVVVGGGERVRAVRAAQIVGERSRVIVYEGGRESVGTIGTVVALNGVADRCEVRHAVVGNPNNV